MSNILMDNTMNIKYRCINNRLYGKDRNCNIIGTDRNSGGSYVAIQSLPKLNNGIYENVDINRLSTTELVKRRAYRNYLLSKGIKSKFIKETIDKINENNDDQDFFSAVKLCKKKRIGPSGTDENRPLFYKKDIGILARNGFSFETSQRIMDLSKDDYNKIISLL